MLHMAVVPIYLTFLWQCISSQTTTDCPIIQANNLGSTTSSTTSGLIVTALGFVLGDTGTVQLVDYNVVCLAQGSMRDQYRMVSVIASYLFNGVMSLNQFHFQCIVNSWSINVLENFDNSITMSTLVGTLSTPVKRDCRLCTDSTTTFSAAEHCASKFGNLIP